MLYVEVIFLLCDIFIINYGLYYVLWGIKYFDYINWVVVLCFIFIIVLYSVNLIFKVVLVFIIFNCEDKDKK